VLEYFVSGDNLRPALLPALLENPSVSEAQIAKLAVSAMRDTIEIMLKSSRVHTLNSVIETLKSNPYLKKEEAQALRKSPAGGPPSASVKTVAAADSEKHSSAAPASEPVSSDPGSPEDDQAVHAYLKEHEHAIAAEGEKPFQSIGGVVELLGEGVLTAADRSESAAPVATPAASTAPTAAMPKAAEQKKPAERLNTMQKINGLDVKGRIQLALKGNKEERSILIRDGTKVVALAVLEAPKLADGEVEKFAGQKNVLEAVLRQIPLKRRFMKNYIVVRNLVGNPRTPIDLSLGLMKNLLAQDLKNISANKEVSETIRKLALKMYKQKLDAANKK
jgi:hypothetical protein